MDQSFKIWIGCVGGWGDTREMVLAHKFDSRCWIGQDLAHLEMRVFETFPHINPARADFVVAFRDAILKKKADLHGGVADYYSVEESLERLTKVEDKFKKNPDLWNKCYATFELQKGHIAKGCLIPKHQQLPFTTSNNENWHNAAGEPFRGSVSSLTTVLSVLPDIFLRKNLLKVIEAGTQHIFLADRNLRLEEILYSLSQPKLLDVFSKHEFGLVKREKQFTGVDLDRYKAKRKELLQTLKPDDIEHPEVIVMAVMNGTVVMNQTREHSFTTFCEQFIEKRMATQLDSEDDATTTLAISSKRPHLNRELLELNIKPLPLPSFWNFIKSNSPHLPQVWMWKHKHHQFLCLRMLPNLECHRPLLQQQALRLQIIRRRVQFKSCRLQFKATSLMTEKQLKLFAVNYNNPQLILNPAYYNAQKGVPRDKIIRDGLVLKNGLFAIEKEVASRIQRVARGDSIKPFWKLQTTLPPPVKVTYMKPTKKGNFGAVKTCGRCKKQKDGYGEKNTNNHKHDICDDNFMHWSKVPYPLPKTNLHNVPLCKNMLGKWSIDENVVKKFFTDIKDGKVPAVDQSVEMVNICSCKRTECTVAELDNVNIIYISGLPFALLRSKIRWIMAKQCGIAFFDVYEGNNSIIYVAFKRLNRKTHWVLMSEKTDTFLFIDTGSA
ncbi:hypothetical protein BT69DRAFT_1295109 [Atractiella rhizophila]|nr:hypothetical protein BT69DRAFT_1295109 [Atractiella rhizophila]